MLITVKKPKLVLGRTVYFRGDVFECRDAEAVLLVAGGMATKSPAGAKATAKPPTPPTTGMSKKAGTLPASTQSPAGRVARARAKLTEKPAPAPVATVAQVAPPTPPTPAPVVRPVGAITMPQPGTSPKA